MDPRAFGEAFERWVADVWGATERRYCMMSAAYREAVLRLRPAEPS